MKIVRLLVIFSHCLLLNGRFTLYSTDVRESSSSAFDCIYADLYEDHRDTPTRFTRSIHLIPYCRRPDTDEIIDHPFPTNTKVSKIIAFTDLKKQGVTSSQLIEWMSPIDVAERYEMHNGDMLEVFYNCSPPWFGSRCQYKFDFDTSLSFGDIVSAIFKSRRYACRVLHHQVCYPFLPTCYRGPTPICLDWREICDGKYDCINGEDEQLCEQLEFNKCNDAEYRCHYGSQCIPLEFVDDGRKNIDCLDASDEIDAGISYDTVMIRTECYTIPTFVCEERICRYPHSFSCGDGDCVIFDIPDPSSKLCYNRRRMEINFKISY